MFDGAGQDAAGWIASQAEQGEVVRLGGTAGKDDLIGKRTEQLGDLLASVLKSLASLATVLMSAGRVAVDLGEKGPHRLPHLGEDGRGGTAVEVNHATHCSTAFRRLCSADAPSHQR